MINGQGDLGIFLLGISTKRLVYLERAWYLAKALSIWRKDLLYREKPWYIEDALGIWCNHLVFSAKNYTKRFLCILRPFSTYLGFSLYSKSLLYIPSQSLIYQAIGRHNELYFFKVIQTIHGQW